MCYRPSTDKNNNTSSTIPQTKCVETCCKSVKITNLHEKIQTKSNDEFQSTKCQEVNKSIGKVCAKVKPESIIQQGLVNSIPANQLTKSRPTPIINEQQSKKSQEIWKSDRKISPKVKTDPIIQQGLVKIIPADKLSFSHPSPIINEEKSKKCEDIDKNIEKLCAEVKPNPVQQQRMEKSKPLDLVIQNHPNPQLAPPRSFPKNKIPFGKRTNSVKDIFEPCDDCNKTHHLNLEKLFKICQENPDFIIETYKKEHLIDNDKKLSKEEYSQIRHIYGEILGNAEYHYLMIDASTSTSIEKNDSTGLIREELKDAHSTDVEEADPVSHKQDEDMGKVEKHVSTH